ncbi:MAG: enoyl-CoA hydratase/isomerase family protein [Waddliaceae bacterium]
MLENSLVLVKRGITGVTELTLNRPEKRNALSIELMARLCKALEEVQEDPSQRVIIIRGEGPVFCSGLDLSEARDPEKTEQSGNQVATMLKTVYLSPLVTIAAVQGAALAGGAGLMSACDFVIAAEDTLFGYPETRRGLVAAQVMAFLTRQLRQRDVRELLLFGEFVDASKALSIGLINRAVPQEQLLKEAYRHAKRVIKGAPQAITPTKKILDEMYPSDFTHDINTALKYHQMMRESDEAKEGIAAFLEKRRPDWERSK